MGHLNTNKNRRNKLTVAVDPGGQCLPALSFCLTVRKNSVHFRGDVKPFSSCYNAIQITSFSCITVLLIAKVKIDGVISSHFKSNAQTNGR